MATLEDAAVAKKLQKIMSRVEPRGSCLEYYKGTTKGNYGRYHMCYPYEGQSFKAQMTASRAVYILEKRRPDMVGEPDTGHVSHLCHNSRCVNIEHLHLEHPSSNEQRKACKIKRECQGSCNPPCIFS